MLIQSPKPPKKMTESYTLSNEDAFATSERFYLSRDLADVHFIFNNNDIEEKIPAHKFILSVLSPVFKAMFFGPMKEGENVKMSDSNADGFKEFLQFFYLRNVSLSMANMEAVVHLADKYDIMKYVENVCSSLSTDIITAENVCWVYQFAHYVEHYPLVKFCENYIIKWPQSVLSSDSFCKIDQEILEHILDLNFKCPELLLIQKTLRWAKVRSIERNITLKAQLDDCFKLFRFVRLRVSDFTKLAMDQPGLFAAEEFQDIMLMISQKNYNPHTFHRYNRYYDWNSARTLQCKRIAKKYENQIINCRGPQVVSFTSNRAFLLGEIHAQVCLRNSNVKISIVDLGDLHSETSPRFVYRDVFEAQENFPVDIRLYKPVLIKPNILYEISLHIEKSFVSDVFNPQVWHSTIELDNGLRLTFHRNPSLPYDNASYGFISSLDVNLIETN